MPLFEEGVSSLSLDGEQLQLILAGIDLDSIRRRKRFCLNS
jgi:hypothetical protein